VGQITQWVKSPTEGTVQGPAQERKQAIRGFGTVFAGKIYLPARPDVGTRTCEGAAWVPGPVPVRWPVLGAEAEKSRTGVGLSYSPMERFPMVWTSRMVCRFFGRMFIVLLGYLSVGISQAAWGQATASVVGTVRDADGRPLPGVLVELTGPQGIRKVVTTDAQGRYRIEGLPSGDGYRLRCVQEGFLPGVIENISVRPDEPVSVDVTLQVGAEAVIVVTPSRLNTSPEKLAATVQVLSRSDLMVGPQLLVDDALRQVPGFSLFRRSSSLVSHPTAQGVTFRGAWPSGVSRALVLLDGVPLNDPFGGWIYWNRVPRSALRQVEVIKSPVSTAWGHAGMGGAVHFRTEAIGLREFQVDVQGGGLGSVDADTAWRYRVGSLNWLVAGRYFRTDGYYLLPPDQRGSVDVRAFSRMGSLWTRWTWEASSRRQVFLMGNVFSERRGNGTPYTENATDLWMAGLGTRWFTTGGDFWEVGGVWQAQTFQSTFSSVSPDRSRETPSLNQYDVPAVLGGFYVQWSRPQPSGAQWSAGVDVRYIWGETREDFRWVSGQFTRRRLAGGRQAFVGLYLNRLFQPVSGLFVQIGARWDGWGLFRGRRLERDLLTDAVLRDDRYAVHRRLAFSPTLGVRWQVRPWADLRFQFSQGFRAPTLNELYRPFQVRNVITAANPDLRPEFLQAWELGADLRAGGRWQGSATLFWYQVRDAISNVTVLQRAAWPTVCGFVPAGGLCRQRQNVDQTRVLGVDLMNTFRLSPHFQVSLGYLWNDARIRKSPVPDLIDKRVAQVPEHTGVFRVQYQHPRFLTAVAQARYESSRFEDDLNTLRLRSVWVVDASVRRTIVRGVELYVSAENLFDARVEAGRSPDGTVTLGTPRVVRAGLHVQM